jgi:hypothetical protein
MITLVNQALWDDYQSINTDPVGAGIMNYAQRWAELMEQEMAKGKSLPEVAMDTSLEADTDNMSGMTFFLAVRTLVDCWAHGEELRQWHNARVAGGKHPSLADRPGMLINPSIINFNMKVARRRRWMFWRR